MLKGAAILGSHNCALAGRVSHTSKSPAGLAQDASRGHGDEPLRNSQFACSAGQRALFSAAFFPILPEGQLTRLPETRRFRDISSLNNGLHRKLTTVFKNTSQNIGDNILHQLEVCSS